MAPSIREIVSKGEDWHTFIEFYHPDLKECFYTFDSIENLIEILENPVIDLRNIRDKCKNLMKSMQTDGLKKWKKILIDDMS